MRIGLISGEYPPMQGGVGAYSQILAHELAQQGHDVHLFSSHAAQSDTLPLTKNPGKWGLSALRAISAWARSSALDIISLQFQTAAYGMSPWIHFLPAYVRHTPVITTFHDLRFPYLFPKAGPLRDWIVLHLARSSAGVIVTNHEDEQRIAHLPYRVLIPIGSNILNALPAGFDSAHWREQAGAAPGDYLLAYFGLMNQSKGVDVLLQSLAQLRERGLPVRLVLVGGRTGSSDTTNAVYAGQIDTLIQQHNLQPSVSWTGFVDETAVSAYLAASDGVVLPFLDGASYRRGSLMAAIHYGCPIVTTIPRVHIPAFIHGDNMLFVPPGDSAALADILADLLTDAPMRQQLRQGALKLAAQFDWGVIANDYTNFFQRVTGATA